MTDERARGNAGAISEIITSTILQPAMKEPFPHF